LNKIFCSEKKQVPEPCDGIQVNFCKNPLCPNFGIPASPESQSRGRYANPLTFRVVDIDSVRKQGILIYDASPIRLPLSLSNIFPGNRNNHSPACLKLSALYRMSVRSVQWLKLTAQKTHDSQILPDLEQSNNFQQ